MLLDLKEIFQNEGSQKQVDYSLSMSGIEYDGVYPFKSPVSVSALSVNRASLVDLEISVKFLYTRNCDRCFEEFSREMEMTFNHKLAVSLENDENDDYIETPDYKLELDDLVISDIILNLPSKNLCREDCRGLCQKCGQNLNCGDCQCNKTKVDPRLEILKQLID
ncbi:MAG: YceD family protein [Ruminococcus sp.]